MFINNLVPKFDSLDDFVNKIGSYNKESTNCEVIGLNELLLKGLKSDNSLNITLFREHPILKAGQTYTISCEFQLKQKIGKSLPYDVPKIAFDGVENGENKWDVQSSSSIPNEIGIWHKSLTVTVPKNFTHAWFRIHLGIEKGAGEIIVRNIFISNNNFVFGANPLFVQKGNLYWFRSLTDKDRVEIYTEFSDCLKLKKHQFLQYMIEKIDHSTLTNKVAIYKSLSEGNLNKVIQQISVLFDELDEQDETLVSDICQLFDIKSEWRKMAQFIAELDKRGLYQNSSAILYQKAQMYRRLEDAHNEKNAYQRALILDTNKPKLDYNLFFDKYNPGLSYRLRELNFIIKHLAAIQQIADNYHPINIDFKQAPVFVFWDQGYDNAPPIVKAMIDRMRQIYQERLVLLTGENLEHYVDLSAGIRKFRETKRAQFSDYVRTELLVKYGGTWIDSTALTTKRFDQEVTDALTLQQSNLYVLRIPENPYRISNWFIATNQRYNRILTLMHAAFLIFAEQKDDLFEYYQYHTFFEILTQLDNKAKQDFVISPKNDYQPKTHELLKHMRQDWNQNLFDKIISHSPIQKLTYRINIAHLRTQSVYKTLLRMRNGILFP